MHNKKVLHGWEISTAKQINTFVVPKKNDIIYDKFIYMQFLW